MRNKEMPAKAGIVKSIELNLEIQRYRQLKTLHGGFL
jgi:hypothetical protein